MTFKHRGLIFDYQEGWGLSANEDFWRSITYVCCDQTPTPYVQILTPLCSKFQPPCIIFLLISTFYSPTPLWEAGPIPFEWAQNYIQSKIDLSYCWTGLFSSVQQFNKSTTKNTDTTPQQRLDGPTHCPIGQRHGSFKPRWRGCKISICLHESQHKPKIWWNKYS